jgi:effector-binding domain-containing protein
MDYDIRSIELESVHTAVVRGNVAMDDISTWLPAAYDEVFGLLARRGIIPAGPPFARYDLNAGTFEIEAGAPVASWVVTEGRVRASSLPGGMAAVTTHIGPYDQLGDAVTALTAWIGAHAGEPTGAHWEVYHSDPIQEPDPRFWRTDVVMPMRSVARPVR